MAPLLFVMAPTLGDDSTPMYPIFALAIAGLHALSVAIQGVVENPAGVVRWTLAGATGAILLWLLGLEIKLPLMLICLGYLIFDWRRRRITAAVQKGDTEVRPAQR